MTDFAKQAAAIIRSAEQQVLALLAEAAEKRDYVGIDDVSNAARGLEGLAKRVESESTPKSESARSQPAGNGSARTPATNVPGTQTVRRRPKRGDYPRFLVADDALVKIGWSKKEKDEYSQRTPKSTFDIVLQVLDQLGQSGGSPVTSDQILHQLETEASPPSYQTYAVLAFLRVNGVIRQVARGAYAIPPECVSLALGAWEDAKSP